MSSNLSDLADQVSLTPYQALGIPIALVGAMFLSIGAQLQHRGVAKIERKFGRASSGFSIKQLTRLIGRPSWVIGTALCALAIVFQLTSLSFAPLIVVQPLGAVALVVTAILNSRTSHQKLSRPAKRSILFCVGGVALFVGVAALTAVEHRITTGQIVVVLVILAVIFAIFLVAFSLFRRRIRALFYIIGAGFMYGFVATMAKIIINRVEGHHIDVLTVICFLALCVVGLLGGYFVTNAYSSGPPDLVIAGLTVIDPMVAVGIGVIVLGEASHAPWWASIFFVIAGALAVFGVFQLAKYHPQTRA
ncbi:multidrug DMT transporter permease [Frondihabitans sp. PAMC 28766]|uniref:DMT family transporter n=1 Tax=Frondihabitans sp. PAMC 28766 TaxID=1795630 RepID=UPI00078E75CD|nr:DMT family transporter [Frondihabitans sp. PAMC 28766]AMM21052.1 multidrug DMT transporter permease [Frondihabitans sp. PAMC 28766]